MVMTTIQGFALRGGSDTPATQTKVCPQCGQLLFADMDVCYGCMYDFAREAVPPAVGLPDGGRGLRAFTFGAGGGAPSGATEPTDALPAPTDLDPVGGAPAAPPARRPPSAAAAEPPRAPGGTDLEGGPGGVAEPPARPAEPLWGSPGQVPETDRGAAGGPAAAPRPEDAPAPPLPAEPAMPGAVEAEGAGPSSASPSAGRGRGRDAASAGPGEAPATHGRDGRPAPSAPPAPQAAPVGPDAAAAPPRRRPADARALSLVPEVAPSPLSLRIHSDSVDVTVPLPPAGLSVGRLADNDVVLHARSVSRRHVRISPEGDGATVEDLGATNPVLFCGQEAPPSLRMVPGDAIDVCGTVITLACAAGQGGPGVA